MRVVSKLLVSVVVIGSTAPVWSGDWPQILGPLRNGVAENERLADSWAKKGPAVLWNQSVGSGFAGPAVADGRVVLFHRIKQQDFVECIDAESGKSLWKQSFAAKYVPSYTSDDGPRNVPLIHQGRVYVYSAKGLLKCLDLKSGDEVWSRDTFAEYNSGRSFKGEPPEGYFGIGTSPIVEGDKLLLNVGGDTKEAGIVAFSLKDGRTVWKATDERASYSSPIAATIDGVRHVIFATRLNVVSIDPADGSVRFRFPFGRSGPTVTAANPVLVDGHVFVTGSYGFGAVLARVEKSAAKQIWADDDTLSSQYTTPIEHEGKLYGVHGRQDIGRAALRCVDPKTRKVHWNKEGFGYATLIEADGKLLILTTDGELVLAELNAERYRELARATLFETTTRALPALSNGRLFARDERELKCFDLRKSR